MAQPGDREERAVPAGMPGWFKMALAIAVVLLVAVVILHLNGTMAAGHGG